MQQLKLILAICLLSFTAQGQNIHTVSTYNNTHWLFDSTVVPKYNTSLFFYGEYVDIKTDIANFRKIKTTQLLNGDGSDTAFVTGDAIRDYFEALLSDTAGLTPITYVAGDNIIIAGDTISATGGGAKPLDSVLADGNTGYNKNISLDRTSGTHGVYLSNNGTDYGHFEISAAGTQIHQYDGDRESFLSEDSMHVIDNAVGKYSSIHPTYVKTDTVKLNSGLAVNSLVSGATADRVNVMPNASGQIALTTEIPIMAGGSATFVGDDVTTTFTIAHGLGTTPTFSGVWFNNLAANTRRCYWTSADATNVTFTCGTAPINLEQIKMGWIAVKNP